MNDLDMRFFDIIDMRFFDIDADGCGVPFDHFVTALGVWIATRKHQKADVASAADAFRCTHEVILNAVAEHPWMCLSGPSDDHSKLIIDLDGA